MMDSSTPAAAKSLVPLAIAFALVASAKPVRADQPSDSSAPSAPSAAPAAPEAGAASAAPVTPVAPAALPSPGAAVAAATVRPTAEVVSAPGAVTPVTESTAASWFARAPLSVGVGEGDKKWALTFYGFVEADYIMDTTRSYDDHISTSLVARDDTYAGRHGRTQFSMRNTRLGLKFESPVAAGVTPSAVIEGDFYSPSVPSDTPEKTYYDSATFRIRHAYLLLQDAYVDVLAGQTYDVFGWQFARSTQFRLSHNFGASSGPVTFGVAAAAVRPVERDSGVPDANASLRLSFNGWQGMVTTAAVSGSAAQPAFIQVSGVGRQYKANSFAPPPTQRSNTASAWGVSIDAVIPVIPANATNERANCLTLTGSFVTGSGIGDLINLTGGAEFPTLSNPAQANPAPLYNANVDQGLVTFDTAGVLHTIDWRAVKVGLQYYLPPSGRLFFTANYSQGYSTNMHKLFPKGGAEIELLGRVADTSHYGDVNLFWDATPAVRFGLSGAYAQARYLDGDKPHNIRGMGLAQYAF